MIKSSIAVAVGLIINPQNEILVSLRPKHVAQGGLWEFPGGKIEILEDSYQALCRELKEEVNITVIAVKPFMKIDHNYDDHKVTLHTWHVTEFSGDPMGLEGQIIQWVPVEKLTQLPFPEVNQQIIDRLIKRILTEK